LLLNQDHCQCETRTGNSQKEVSFRRVCPCGNPTNSSSPFVASRIVGESAFDLNEPVHQANLRIVFERLFSKTRCDMARKSQQFSGGCDIGCKHFKLAADRSLPLGEHKDAFCPGSGRGELLPLIGSRRRHFAENNSTEFSLWAPTSSSRVPDPRSGSRDSRKITSDFPKRTFNSRLTLHFVHQPGFFV
jgi:hypothetical protein